MSRRISAVLATAFSLLLTACGSGGGTPTPAPAPGTPALTVSTNALAFPSTTVGQTATAQTITLTNSGSATLIFSATASISGPAGFAISANTCLAGALAPAATCAISVTFAPTAAQAYAATLNINDNAANSPQTVALSGTGVAVVVLVPQATLSGSSLIFTGTAAGATSASQTVALTNTGTGPLTLIGIDISGNTTFPAFTQTNTCPTTLAAAASCVLSISFAPAAASTVYTATLTLTDNANNIANATQAIALSGTSAAPVPTAQAVLSPGSLTFPSTTVNTSAGAQTVTLSNPGTASLTGIAISVTGGVTASAFTTTTTCATTLAAAASCTIAVNFTPTIPGTFTATLSVADSATNSPQTIALNGSATAVPAPVATLSSTAITYPATTVNTTTTPYSVTLSNTGNATLNIASIALSGSNFTKSTTCGTTLAPAASCTISATFSPAAASTYTATFTITDNSNSVAGSTQTIALSGTGSTAVINYKLYMLPDPGTGAGSGTLAALYSLVNNAQTTIDMSIYALQDTTFSGYLVAACQRGVKVRVVLDQNNERSHDTPAYNQLNAQTNCSAVWANSSFSVTHAKYFIVDAKTISLMSLNLQTQYYATTRDFAVVYNDPVDIAAVQATFNMDYAAGTLPGGTPGPNDYTYQPGPGNDLIWSPTTAKQKMLDIINNATKTLIIENEELTAAAGYITTAIAAACQRGVVARVTIENQSHAYDTQMTTLKNAGCGVHYYSSSSGFYIHAKAVIADDGLPTQNAYIGSINYSDPSMTRNRELGMYLPDTASVQTMYTAMVADYNNATGIF